MLVDSTVQPLCPSHLLLFLPVALSDSHLSLAIGPILNTFWGLHLALSFGYDFWYLPSDPTYFLPYSLPSLVPRDLPSRPGHNIQMYLSGLK